MDRITVRELFAQGDACLGRTVRVCGWVRSVRDMKAFGFMDVSDGSCFRTLQVVLDGEKAYYQDAVRCHVGAAVVVTGELQKSTHEQQPLELKAETLELEGASAPDYPLQKKRHSVEFLRGIAHLRPRTNLFQAAFRVRSECSFALHSFFHERGFVYVHTPIITSSDCEGAGEMFRLTTLPLGDVPRTPDGGVDYSRDFFGKPANLTVSGQLNAEAFAQAFGKTYTFGPTFRAERSNTPRHAAEFWMLEPEIAFSDLNDDMRLAEEMLRFVVGYLFEHCADELEFFNRYVDTGLLDRLRLVRDSGFARVSYTDAVRELAKSGERFAYPVSWGCDLQTEHERYLTEKLIGKPAFVTDYPKEIKAFYMRQNDDGKTVAAMDLLVPGVGELIGGSQREERLPVLEARMRECGLKPEEYWWYLDLRRYGSTRHCGFGLGFERLIMYVTGIANIRDVLPFPRTTGQADF